MEYPPEFMNYLRKTLKNQEHLWLKEKITLEQKIQFQEIEHSELKEHSTKERSMHDQTVAALEIVIEENRVAMEASYQRLADGYAQR